MRIGIDLDGCGYQMVKYLREGMIRAGVPSAQLPAVTEYHFAEQWGMSADVWHTYAAEAVDSGFLFWRGYPYPGFAECLRVLRSYGHTIHIITARVAAQWGERAAEATTSWLHAYEIPFDSLTFSGDKTIIPTDVFIDDYPVHLEQLAKAGTLAVAYDQPYNQDWRGLRVYGWDDFKVLVGLLSTPEKIDPDWEKPKITDMQVVEGSDTIGGIS